MNHIRTLSIISLFLLLTGVLRSMPPHPDWVKEADEEAVSRVQSILLDAHARGMNAPGASILDRLRPLRRDDPNEQITLNVAVILTDFADNEADRDNYPQEHYLEMLFSVDEYETGSMRDFYLENSNGEVSIVGEVAGWYRMPQTYAYYCNHRYGLGVYPRNAQKLAADAILAADDDLDYSEFDNDDDGVVEAVFIVFAGSGAEEDPDNSDLIWSHAWTTRGLDELDGVRFRKYSAVPEDGRIGVYGHELGHAMFGLPDLYDTEYESAGIGFWSMMSYGSWGDDGRRPLHFDAWCKLQLGWVNPRMLEYDTEFSLLPVEQFQQVIVLWNPEARGDEYFLIENRQRIGFDGEILGEGLLVYHVDENEDDNDHPWWPNNEGFNHNLVALEQADGRWDLETFENDADDGDPFPGSEDNHTFDANSEPGSRDYQNEETGIAILEIDVGEHGIQSHWQVGVEAEIVEQVIALHEGWNMIGARVIPESDDIREIFSPLIERNNLIFVKDKRGRFFVPIFDFNNIPFWNPTEGYKVLVRRDDELTFTGQLIDAQMTIQLRRGWQIVPYYPDYEMPVRRAFMLVINRLQVVKDEYGNFYLPEFDYSNMGDLRPGRSYYVRVLEDVQLVFPPAEE